MPVPAPTRASWLTNLWGGALAGLITLPVDISYGLIAFAPLGPGLAGLGVAGMGYAAIFGGLAALLAGLRPGQLFGARSSLAMIVATLILHLLAQSAYQGPVGPRVDRILAMVAACTALAALIQWGFAALRLGRLVKFMPLPVLSGFNLGVATVMSLVALRQALDLPTGAGGMAGLVDARPGPALVCALTLAACFAGRRWLPRVPPLLTGLVAGLLLQQGLVRMLPPGVLGGGFAAQPLGLPDPSLLAPLLAPDFAPVRQLADLLPFALALATLATIETLLCAASLDNLTGSRHDSRREIRALGFATLASALTGGLPGGGSMGRSAILLGTPARERIASLGYVAVIALVLGLAAGWLAHLPRAVAAGLLLFLAWGLVDDWTRASLRQLLTRPDDLDAPRLRLLRQNLGMTLLVALVAVVGNLMQAVFVGVAAAILLFVRHNSRACVRRVEDGTRRRSLKVRAPEAAEQLRRHGARIALIEAEGMLFFGTADQLAATLDDQAERADWLVLDLARVSDCDTTGALILRRAQARLSARGKLLLLCGVGAPARPRAAFAGVDLGPLTAAGLCHATADDALEQAENALLTQLSPTEKRDAPLTLGATTLGEGLDPEALRVLGERLISRQFAAGSRIFTQGQPGSSLFVSLRGSVGIRVALPDGTRLRVASFGPGVVFGEMAVLEGKPRSAEAVAEDAVLALELPRAQLDQLADSHPRLALHVMRNLGRGLSTRLRDTTDELRAAHER